MNGYGDWNKLDDSRSHLRRKACHDEQQFSKDSLVSAMENFVKTVNIMNETILVPCRLMDREVYLMFLYACTQLSRILQIGDDTDIYQGSSGDSDSNSDKSKIVDRSGLELKNVHEVLKQADLFNLFNILNATKNDLLWTGSETVNSLVRTDFRCLNNPEEANTVISTNQEISTNQAQDMNLENNTLSETNVKGHNRRPSTASLSSIASISDFTSDFSAENDSGVESEGQCGVKGNGLKAAYSVKSDKATELAKLCKFHLFGLYQCLEQMTEAANYLTTRYQSDVGSG